MLVRAHYGGSVARGPGQRFGPTLAAEQLWTDHGVRVAVSTVFGEFADRRDSLAAERPLDPVDFDAALDYRDDQGSEFWLDFAADSGDGWDSTYAVARLLGQPSLAIPNCPDGALPRGRILVFGRPGHILADIDLATYPAGRLPSLRGDIQQMLQSNAPNPEIANLTGRARQ